MGPIDYSLPGIQQTPTQALGQGYALGQGIRNDIQQQTALQQQAQQLYSLVTNPNAGANDYAAASVLFPQLKDQLKQSWDMKNTAQQESNLRDMGQAYSAVVAGRPDLAVQMMQQRADAMEKAGANPRDVQALRTNAQVIQTNPDMGRTTMGMMLANLPGGDKVLTGVTSAGAEARAQENAPAILAKNQATAGIEQTENVNRPAKLQAEIGNTTSQINERAQRLGLDQDKFRSELQFKLAELKQKAGELPEDVRKDLNTATTDAIASDQSAQKMLGLASDLEKEGGGYGSFSTAGEWLKNKTGNQNEMTRLRSEYSRIVTPAAMTAYKKMASGSTSDKDIETAMVGVPPANADSALMASFLRGAAKLQMYDSALNNAKSEWLAANKSFAKSPSDMTIDGVQVPAGTTFKNFTDQYLQKKVNALSANQTVNSLAAKYGGGQ